MVHALLRASKVALLQWQPLRCVPVGMHVWGRIPHGQLWGFVDTRVLTLCFVYIPFFKSSRSSSSIAAPPPPVKR
eukprot:scaffold169850_cov12-Tisochrysis_lutea.AAC.1